MQVCSIMCVNVNMCSVLCCVLCVQVCTHGITSYKYMPVCAVLCVACMVCGIDPN